MNRFALKAKKEISLSIAYYRNQFFSLQYNNFLYLLLLITYLLIYFLLLFKYQYSADRGSATSKKAPPLDFFSNFGLLKVRIPSLLPRARRSLQN